MKPPFYICQYSRSICREQFGRTMFGSTTSRSSDWVRAVRRWVNWVNWGSGRAAAGRSARVSGRATAMRRESMLAGCEKMWRGNWGVS
jgi:hypothetical protein